MNDPLGIASRDFLNGIKNAEIIVESNIAEDDVLPVEYLFRPFVEMPELERKALTLSYGKILDVGAGVGSHALYLRSDETAWSQKYHPSRFLYITRRNKIRYHFNDDEWHWYCWHH